MPCQNRCSSAAWSAGGAWSPSSPGRSTFPASLRRSSSSIGSPNRKRCPVAGDSRSALPSGQTLRHPSGMVALVGSSPIFAWSIGPGPATRAGALGSSNKRSRNHSPSRACTPGGSSACGVGRLPIGKGGGHCGNRIRLRCGLVNQSVVAPAVMLYPVIPELAGRGKVAHFTKSATEF